MNPVAGRPSFASECRRRRGSRPVAGDAMPEAHADRQLLAIMFTDVVGYTAITERDEASAVRIREAHRNLTTPPNFGDLLNVRQRPKLFGGSKIVKEGQRR